MKNLALFVLVSIAIVACKVNRSTKETDNMEMKIVNTPLIDTLFIQNPETGKMEMKIEISSRQDTVYLYKEK